MQQNLRTTHYNNGDAIMEIEDSAAWHTIYNSNSQTPAWCYYDGNAANNAIYGKLYNWYVVADPRGVCPTGFHVAADSDFIALEDAVGGPAVASGFLKSTSSLWMSPNYEATNSSGFSALPGGYRGNFGGFHNVGTYAYFWGSTQPDTSSAWVYILGYNAPEFWRDTIPKEFAYSIRCIGN